MIWLIIVALFFTVIIVIAQIITFDKYIEFSNSGNIVAAAIGFLAMLCVGIYLICLDNKPKAIDVYRGNTTLEITYRNDIPIDSVVVFK